MSAMQSLWPEAIKQKVLRPYTILRAQAELLSKLTRAVLEGVIETEKNEKEVQHRLVVIAPAWNGYRQNLLTLVHSISFPYPTEVRAESLKESGPLMLGPGSDRPNFHYPNAANEKELEFLIGKALQSSETSSILESLIANSTDNGIESKV